MFDVSQISKRYFDIRLAVENDDGETNAVELQVEPPTVRQLNNLLAVSKADPEDAVTELRDAVRSILSKNRTGYKVPDEYMDEIDMDQLSGILMAYLSWVGDEKKAKN